MKGGDADLPSAGASCAPCRGASRVVSWTGGSLRPLCGLRSPTGLSNFFHASGMLRVGAPCERRSLILVSCIFVPWCLGVRNFGEIFTQRHHGTKGKVGEGTEGRGDEEGSAGRRRKDFLSLPFPCHKGFDVLVF